jgi:hypothetical protein
MEWFLWALSLVMTQFFGTLTSRARNTSSYAYHGVCAALNHGSWLVAQTFLVTVAVKNLHDPRQFVQALIFYTGVSTASSIFAHVVSINYFEKGKRRVGAYGDSK